MNKKIISSFIIGCGIVAATSCSIDETNYSSLDQEIVYPTEAGFNGLVEACYENIYYLYGKMDGIDLMEMGTDLWMNGGRNDSHGELTNYNENLNTSTGVVRVVWNALYGTVAYCNTAIYYQDRGNDSTRKAKVAEAYFLRGFANWHIVEKWGQGIPAAHSPVCRRHCRAKAICRTGLRDGTAGHQR